MTPKKFFYPETKHPLKKSYGDTACPSAADRRKRTSLDMGDAGCVLHVRSATSTKVAAPSLAACSAIQRITIPRMTCPATSNLLWPCTISILHVLVYSETFGVRTQNLILRSSNPSHTHLLRSYWCLDEATKVKIMRIYKGNAFKKEHDIG
jgi:hypothetical protein